MAISLWICEQAGGATPLFIASQEGHLKVVSALLAAGANKDAATVCFCVCEPLQCESGLTVHERAFKCIRYTSA